MKLLLFLFSLTNASTIWPHPLVFTAGQDTLIVSDSFRIVYDYKNLMLSEAVNRTLVKMFSLGCFPSPPSLDIKEELEALIIEGHYSSIPSYPLSTRDEHYSLSLREGEKVATLNGNTILGILRGLESFSQLIQVSQQVPYWAKENCGHLSHYFINTPIVIVDEPIYSHRGLLLDTGRHFMPTSIIRKILDGMEASKLNILHWHIVDAQSFPMQSLLIPELSGIGAYSEFEIYTGQDVEGIVDYAQKRGIIVMPEFDVPGHAYSWRGTGLVVCKDARPWVTYCAGPPCGQLDISNNRTFSMLEVFLREMSALFPDNLLHLGHDEVNMNCYLDEPGLLLEDASLNQLLQTFQDKLQDISRQNNKNIVFWEDIILDFPTLVPNNTIIQSWRGPDSTRRIVERGYKVIVSDSKAWYLDCGRGSWVTGNSSWCDPYHTWANMYMFDPVANLTSDQRGRVLGGEVSAWSELISPSDALPVIFPRASAAAEALWTAPKNRDWKKAANRFDNFVTTLNSRGIESSSIWPTYCGRGDCLD